MATSISEASILRQQPVPVAQSNVKVTKRNLAKVQEKHLLANIEPMLQEAFSALRDGVRARNPKFIQLAFEVAGMVNPNKSPSIINKVINNNTSLSASSSDGSTTAKVSMESLIRRLDARDFQAVPELPAIDITP